MNVRRRVAARAHGDDSFWNRKRIAVAPIASGIDPNTLSSVHFHNVDGARGGAFCVWIQRHARPHSALKHHAYGVLLNMVNQNARGIYFSMRGNCVQDKSRALEFVLQVRRVDEHKRIVSRGNFQMLLEHGQLRFAVAVQTNLANAKHIGSRQKIRNHAHHFARKAVVLGLFGIDANPRVVRNAVRGGAAWFAFSELAEIIMKASGAAAIKARPKCGLGHGHATRGGHARVVVGGAADHVNVWIYIHMFCVNV